MREKRKSKHFKKKIGDLELDYSLSPQMKSVLKVQMQKRIVVTSVSQLRNCEQTNKYSVMQNRIKVHEIETKANKELKEIAKGKKYRPVCTCALLDF